MLGEVYLVPVDSISGHTKQCDNAQNSLYQQDFDAVQRLNEIKLSQYIKFNQKIYVSRKMPFGSHLEDFKAKT